MRSLITTRRRRKPLRRSEARWNRTHVSTERPAVAEVAVQSKVVVDSVFFRTVVDTRHIIAVGPATSAPNEPGQAKAGCGPAAVPPHHLPDHTPVRAGPAWHGCRRDRLAMALPPAALPLQCLAEERDLVAAPLRE